MARKIRLKHVKGKTIYVRSIARRIRNLNSVRKFHRIQLVPPEPRRSSRVKCIKDTSHFPSRILEEDESGLEVTRVPDKGRGVIATQHFQKGAPLLEYVGDRVTRSEAIRRETNMPLEAGSYLFYYRHNGRGYCIDATSELIERKARLVNHSCYNANACMKKVVSSEHGVRLILFASKDISPSDEILYDYGERRREIVCHNSWLLK